MILKKFLQLLKSIVEIIIKVKSKLPTTKWVSLKHRHKYLHDIPSILHIFLHQS
jgi:hypothetical protein